MTKKDELTELKATQAQMAARIAELEQAKKPPVSMEIPKDFQRYDPTANFSMPPSVVREMARAVPTEMVRDVAMRDNRAPSGPSSEGVIPSSQSVGSVRVVGGGNTVPSRQTARHRLNRRWRERSATSRTRMGEEGAGKMAKKGKPTSDDLKKAMALSMMPGMMPTGPGMQPNYPKQIENILAKPRQPLPVIPPKGKRKGR
jgi:hypothetical protein